MKFESKYETFHSWKRIWNVVCGMATILSRGRWVKMDNGTKEGVLFIALLMFQAIHGLTTTFVSNTIVMAGEMHDRDTRRSNSYDVNTILYNLYVHQWFFISNGSIIRNHHTHLLIWFTCFILNPVYENEWCPIICMLTDTHVHRIRNFILMSITWFIYMYVLSVTCGVIVLFTRLHETV